MLTALPAYNPAESAVGTQRTGTAVGPGEVDEHGADGQDGDDGGGNHRPQPRGQHVRPAIGIQITESSMTWAPKSRLIPFRVSCGRHPVDHALQLVDGQTIRLTVSCTPDAELMVSCSGS